MDKVIKSEYVHISTKAVDLPEFPAKPLVAMEDAMEEISPQMLENLEAIRHSIVEDARSKAESIMHSAMAKAQSQKEQLLLEAHSQAQQLQKQAYQDGLMQGMQEKKEELNRFMQVVTATLSEIEQRQQGYFEVYHKDLKYLALDIASKVLQKKIKDEPTEMIDLIKHTTSSMRNVKWITVELSDKMPGLIEFVEDKVISVLAKAEVKADVRPVHDVEFDSCIIESSGGIIDISIKTQLENLKQLLIELDKVDN